MATIFSKIISGDIPCFKIAEDDKHFAFLDINPLAKGHTLVIPKKEVDYIFNMDNDALAALHVFAKSVALALESAISCKRVGVLVIGTEVPHAHIHLIPFQQEIQMAISSKKLKFSNEEMEEIAKKIILAYDNIKNKPITLVFGASLKPERYSNKAIKMLLEYHHYIVAIGGREGNVNGVNIITGHPNLKKIDTITMYMGEKRQKDHEDYLLSLMPRRIIFNPGAENRAFALRANNLGILTEEACTLVLLRTEQYGNNSPDYTN